MISGLILPSVIQTQNFTKKLLKEERRGDSRNVNIFCSAFKFISGECKLGKKSESSQKTNKHPVMWFTFIEKKLVN